MYSIKHCEPMGLQTCIGRSFIGGIFLGVETLVIGKQ
jgi:hypothetical protein